MILNLVRVMVALPVAGLLFLMAAFASMMGGSSVLTAVAVSLGVSTLLACWLWLRRAHARSTQGAARHTFLETMRRVAETVLALSAVAVLTAWVANAFAIRPPRQAKVVAHFQEHRSEYEQLREMIVADKVLGILRGGAEFSREPLVFKEPGSLGIGPDRVSAYRRLMRAARCSRMDVWTNGSVSFAVAAWGAANTGWRVSLVSSREKPSPLVGTIDGFRKKGRQWESAYSPIGEDWYVYIIW